MKLSRVMNDITMPKPLELLLHFDGPTDAYLHIRAMGACNVTGKPLVWVGRKWRVSQHMAESEFVQTALSATLAAMGHEAREQFLYKGQAVFDPHYDVDDLVKLRLTGHQDTRSEPSAS